MTGAEKLPHPLTCNGCSKPLPGSRGVVAWKLGHLKCRECVRREIAAQQAGAGGGRS